MNAASLITKNQRYAFFRACSSACHNLGLNTQDEREVYRKRVMKEETGKDHLALLNRTTDFDRCMTRFARDAGDWQMAAKFATADSYRLAVMIRICCQQIMQLKGLPDGSDVSWNYLRGILEKSHIVCGTYTDKSFWMDISKDSIFVVFKILDTHRRRLMDGLSSIDCIKGFDPHVVYQLQPNDHVRMIFDKAYYDSYNSLKVFVHAK